MHNCSKRIGASHHHQRGSDRDLLEGLHWKSPIYEQRRLVGAMLVYRSINNFTRLLRSNGYDWTAEGAVMARSIQVTVTAEERS
ncbi:MAG: hypothetical protein KA739_19070, partial [Pseudomonadales bacterium]|nr:hypothetical protein [Pseudomonadales bacterium]